MGYKIGSFNLRDFNYSNKTSDGEKIDRDFMLIANIIKKEGFDVLAIQEVNSKSAIEHLEKILNISKNSMQEWSSDFSGKAATTINDPEGYGFIWNNKRLRLLDLPRKNNPTYYKYAGGKDVLRLPYYARFTARGMRGGTNFELRIVNIHIKDSSKESERIEEFNVLVKQILPRICDHQQLSLEGEIMPAYTFLAGDYNLRLDKGDRAEIKIESITDTNYTGKLRYYKTVQEEKTSLKMPKDQMLISDCYASNYDHFTYEYNLVTKLKMQETRIEPLGKYFMDVDSISDKLAAYREKVSDHVPIMMEIHLK